MSQTHTDSIAHPPHSGAPITGATGEHIVFVGGGNMTRAIVAGLLRARSHKKRATRTAPQPQRRSASSNRAIPNATNWRKTLANTAYRWWWRLPI